MLFQVSNNLATENDMTSTCLCYKFKLSCDKKVDLYDIATKHTCGMSLATGVVISDGSLPCSSTEIRIPPCQTHATISWPVEVEIEAHSLPLCEDMGECTGKSTMDDGCMACCIWTCTTKKANKSCACIGDTVTYTITFANHSPCTLDMVYISDDVPADITVVPSSIHPAPKPGETLQTGISVGSVPACSSVIMTYQVRIHSCTSNNIINRARATYYYKDGRGCMRYGVGKCTQSIVKILPGKAKISITKSANKRFVCAACEEIIYTLAISNTGNSTVTDITVFDDIPKGLCYKENSTRQNDAAPTNENPSFGINIASLLPGETHLVSFILVVCIPICCICHPIEFVNTARASGYSCDKKISAKSEPWVVTTNVRYLCQCVRVCFPVCDFIAETDCYIYHRGATYHELGDWRLVIARYEICIKYYDNSGAIRNKVFESNVTFFDLPQDFTPDQFTIRFTHLNCCSDFCGNMIAEFAAHLHYCKKR